MKRWQCPWYDFEWKVIPHNYHEEQWCNLFSKKTKCLFQDDPTIDIGSCRRVKQFIDALGKKHKSKLDREVLYRAFITSNAYLNELLQEVGRDPYLFRVTVGRWLQEKCRKDVTCPFKPLLPENP